MRTKAILTLIVVFFIFSIFAKCENVILDYKNSNKTKLISNDTRNTVKLIQDKSFSIKQVESESFIKMASNLIYEDSKFYILDNNRHKVVIFDENGKYYNSFGRHGRGPGDIYFPNLMEIHQKKIYISNGNGIDIFDVNGKFVDRIRCFLPIASFAPTKDNIICTLGGRAASKKDLLLFLDYKGAVKDHIASDDAKESFFRFNKDGTILSKNNLIIYISRHFNRIYIYNKMSKKLVRRRIDCTFFDDLQKWNGKNPDSRQKNVYWISDMFAASKLHGNNFLIMVQVPWLHFILVDSEGKILKHFWNDTDFANMKWIDFDVMEYDNRLTFYALGHSIGENTSYSSLEFNIFRLNTK